MFRPPSLLASQIVPTATAIAAGQLRRLHPSRTYVVTFARIGYAIRPTTGNWRNEDLHLARFAALSAAHTPASLLDKDCMCSRAPSLRGHYPASPLLRARPPPSRLRSLSRFCRLYGLPCSTDFSMGRGRFLQLLDMSLSPCCPYHPAEVTCRFGQPAPCHVMLPSPDHRGLGLWIIFFVEATSGFTHVTAR